MIRVVNKRRHKGDAEYVGRPSPLGNPYTHMQGTIAQHTVATREEAIARYRVWLAQELALNPNGPAATKLAELVNKYRTDGELVLSCWCRPAACHADVIAEEIERRAATSG